MKVIMKATTFSDGRTYDAGKTYDVENIRADGWIDRGLAQEPSVRKPRRSSAASEPEPEVSTEAEPAADTDGDEGGHDAD